MKGEAREGLLHSCLCKERPSSNLGSTYVLKITAVARVSVVTSDHEPNHGTLAMANQSCMCNNHGHGHGHGHGHTAMATAMATATATATATAMATAMAMAMAMAMAIAIAMAMAMAMATAMAVIRPEYAEGRRNHENRLFMKKCVF